MEGKYAEAEAEFRALVPLAEKVFGPENPYTLDTRYNLAQALDKKGNTSRQRLRIAACSN